MTRIEKRFAQLAEKGETAFVSYVMAGDPDIDTSLDLIQDLPSAGVDILEIGVPFTDPMADGPTIQLAATRSLDHGATLAKVLDLVERFRAKDNETPIVLMGYYNPIHNMGVDAFLTRAKQVGVDGLIVVDLPPEEDAELCIPANVAGLNFIRLTTPTTDNARLPAVSKNTSGFVYYVSVNGITGAAAAQADTVGPEVARLKAAMGLPICVGFGVRDPQTAAAIGAVSDGVVVGSAIVKMVEEGRPKAEILDFVRGLSQGAKSND